MRHQTHLPGIKPTRLHGVRPSPRDSPFEDPVMGTTTLIRNSTVEFLIFTSQTGDQSIEARYEDDSIWLSQKPGNSVRTTAVNGPLRTARPLIG